jgi:hypothetical protein
MQIFAEVFEHKGNAPLPLTTSSARHAFIPTQQVVGYSAKSFVICLYTMNDQQAQIPSLPPGQHPIVRNHPLAIGPLNGNFDLFVR